MLPGPRRLEADRDGPRGGDRHADRRRLGARHRARPRARARDRRRRLPRQAVLDEGARRARARRRAARHPPRRDAARRADRDRGARIDPREVQAYVDGESAELTPTEFRLLYQLALERGRVSTRDELLQKLWGRRESHRDRTVDVFVRRLREKIDRPASRHTFIQTRYGVGYKLEAVPEGYGVQRARSRPTRPSPAAFTTRRPRHGAQHRTHRGMKFAVVAHRQERDERRARRRRSVARICRHPCCPRATRSAPSSPETSRWDGSTSAKSSTGSRAGTAELERLAAGGRRAAQSAVRTRRGTRQAPDRAHPAPRGRAASAHLADRRRGCRRPRPSCRSS